MSDITTRARALLAAATPGPWVPDAWYNNDGGWAAIGPHHMATEDEGYDDVPESPAHHRAMADAALIAAAPELLAALCDEVERLRAVEAESAAMREALPSILDSHRKWLMASERAGETQAYIEQQGESPWPFRGSGPEATERRLADLLAKAEELYSAFRRSVDGFGSRGPALLDRLAAAEAERDALRAEVERLRARKAERCSRRILWDDGCCPRWCAECGGSGAVMVKGDEK